MYYSDPICKFRRALIKAISIVGNKSELSREIGASPSAITHWTQGNKRMKYEYALGIEKATGGEVKASDLFLSKHDFERSMRVRNEV